MDEKTKGQLRVIHKVIAAMQTADISAWLFGGWGLDARIGRITREHGDVEFWVERIHAERSKAVLVGAGATALTTQPPEESCEFTLDDVPFSTAYFDRRPDGSSIQLLGRWSDWLFPPGSFGDEPGMLDGTPVLAMSVSGMLAMKEQFPRLRNGRPWRQKDITDIGILRELASGEGPTATSEGPEQRRPSCGPGIADIRGGWFAACVHEVRVERRNAVVFEVLAQAGHDHQPTNARICR
jgi:Aminoglycoside-2''-adenylyltransferase